VQTNQAHPSPRRRRIERRPYSACDGLSEFLAREFEATDFDFGWLTFAVEQTAEDVAVDGVVPEWFEKATVHDYYSGFIVAHPELGMFLLDEPWSLLDDEAPDPGETLRDEYEKLRRLASEIPKTLYADDSAAPCRPLAWHCAVVVDDSRLVSAAVAAGVPERATLLLDDDAILPDLLRALADGDHDARSAHRADDSPSAQQLLAPIAEHLGPCFVESEAYVAGCQLDALAEVRQQEGARRAAEKVGIIEYFEPPFGDDGSF
jgi:hypothetical protein